MITLNRLITLENCKKANNEEDGINCLNAKEQSIWDGTHDLNHEERVKDG